ncbi:hypothetical protein JCM19240_523 [Vibrio maritimus]|uniref:Uncharacterized protein n=1 Tax=Vibrio maritimus TaxID=990268 RepID=A0A090T6V9_9VIBR|nr:hypothetical protein JCM19240_523 [Vibrio maritimus]
MPQGINEQSLAESGIDATGAIAIMNIGSWLNWLKSLIVIVWAPINSVIARTFLALARQ